MWIRFPFFFESLFLFFQKVIYLGYQLQHFGGISFNRRLLAELKPAFFIGTFHRRQITRVR